MLITIYEYTAFCPPPDRRIKLIINSCLSLSSGNMTSVPTSVGQMNPPGSFTSVTPSTVVPKLFLRHHCSKKKKKKIKVKYIFFFSLRDRPCNSSAPPKGGQPPTLGTTDPIRQQLCVEVLTTTGVGRYCESIDTCSVGGLPPQQQRRSVNIHMQVVETVNFQAT